MATRDARVTARKKPRDVPTKDATKAATKRGDGGARPAKRAGQELTPERRTALQAQARAVPEESVRRAPRGSLRGLLAWLDAIQQAAVRHRAALLAVTLHPEPDLAPEEIDDLGEWIALLREADAAVRAKSPARKAGGGGVTEAQARAHEVVVLDGLAHIFRTDAAMLDRVRRLRRGRGIADLVGDVAEIQAIWREHPERVARLSLDEGAHLSRLVAAKDALVGASGVLPPDEARALRDRVYSVVKERVRRVREAARYRFRRAPEVLATFPGYARPRPRRTTKTG